MNIHILRILCSVVVVVSAGALQAAETAPPYWFEPMMKVNAGFTGNPGYVAQFGDSITFTRAFWTPVGYMEPDSYLTADDGLAKRPKDKRWRDTLKGVLAKGPEHANQSGWTVNNLLSAVPAVLKREGPEAAMIGIGTNDTGPKGAPASYEGKLEKVLQLCLEAHCIPILNTIPPKRGCDEGVAKTNAIIRALAQKYQIPLVDYHAEVIRRQPGKAWDGTLMSGDGVHPSAEHADKFDEEHLNTSGYALRTWMNFLVVREVYLRVMSAPKPFIEKVGTVESVRPGVRCEVIADTEVSSYSSKKDNERIWNWGAAETLKMKGYEEYVLMKFNTEACKGMTVKRATLYLSKTNQCVLNVVSASTVSADWQEGEGIGEPKDRANQGNESRGGATFQHAVHPDGTWAGPGSNFKWSVYGEGGSLWSVRETGWAKDDKAEYYTVDIDLGVAQALLIEGDTYGLALCEEKGQRAFQSTYRSVPNPNHFIHAKESQTPCFLVLEGEVSDTIPPAPVADLVVKPGQEAGDVWLSWTCTGDDGAAGGQAQGYRVYVSTEPIDAKALNPKDLLPRYVTYRPKAVGEKQEFPVYGLKPDVSYYVAVITYDEVGNASPAALAVGKSRAEHQVQLRVPETEVGVGGPLVAGGLQMWASASNERINPISGNNQAEDAYLDADSKGSYRNGNDVWDGQSQRVVVYAGRNDFSGFQLTVEGLNGAPVHALEITCSDFVPETKTSAIDQYLVMNESDPAAFQAAMEALMATDKAKAGEVFAGVKRLNELKKQQSEAPEQFFTEMSALKTADQESYARWMWLVSGGQSTGAANGISASNVEIFWEWSLKGEGEAWYPDALVPVTGPLSIPNKDNGISGQRNQTFFVDVWVPHDAKPGVYLGALAVKTKGNSVTSVPIRLTVWDFTLPDELSFISDMNGYQYPNFLGPNKWEGSIDMHKLAHRNRLNVNIVPVSHSGNFIVPEMSLDVKGHGAGAKVVSFDNFERNFGSLLSGKAFEKNPRAGVPVPAFYLPFYENWPMTLKDGFVFDQSARHADVSKDFSQEYRDGYLAVCRQMGEYLKGKKWDKTNFQVFLNSKYQYAPEITFWLLDEPMYRDDYKIIEFFGDLTREGFRDASPVVVDYRIDCSRAEEAHAMMNKVDTFVGSPSNMTTYSRPVTDHGLTYIPKEPGQSRSVWYYGGAGSPTESNVKNRSWSIDAYLSGADGILPWLAYGGVDAWDGVKQAANAIFYPANRWDYNGAYGSLRMKSFRDGQQDVECLALLGEQMGVTRSELRGLLAEFIEMKAAIQVDNTMSLAAAVDVISYGKLSPDDLNRLRRIVGFNLSSGGK